MDVSAVDQIRLNFNPEGLLALNVVIGLMMFGMALDIKVDDFRRILKSPKAPVIGLVAQCVVLPALAYLLTLVIKPEPSLALGMILVAACPGGNVSNLIVYLAKGNVALSVTMTAVSTAAAIFTTPLNLALWGSLNPATAPILRRVSLDPLEVFYTIFVILGVPLALGMLISTRRPHWADKIRKPLKRAAVIVFSLVVVLALVANWSIFLQVIGLVVFVVMLLDGLALATGYGVSRLAGLADADVRAVTIEVGIRNSALGLVLVFNFFEGLGGMAIIAAWWGIWHIVAGLTVAGYWSRTPLRSEPEVMP